MDLPELNTYSLEEISRRLVRGELPLSGITELGSSEFHILEPAHYAGVVMHSRHRVRSGILEILAVDETDRFREEDPYMERFISEFPVQVIARDSRYEYDVNWEIENAIYDADKKKWGMQVWKRELTGQERKDSLAKYLEFHSLLDMLTEFMLEHGRHALVFDMHSFCYQREKKQEWFESNKPDINLGTKSLNRNHFAPVINLFLKRISATRIDGRQLRIAENELFPGGYLTRKYSKLYPDKVLVLALEYKKIFMDEWTGELNEVLLEKLISSFIQAVLEIIPFSLEY